MKLKNKTKILIFGGTGLVGSDIVKILTPSFLINSPSHQEIDVAKSKSVFSYIDKIKPDFIVYSVGITKVDGAEKNPEEAFLLNAKVPESIANYAAILKIPLCYISSDAVFKGNKSKSPYSEDDKTGPLSVYGKSKLTGENAILSASRSNLVVRTIMPYSSSFSGKVDFVRFVLERLKSGEQVDGIIDQQINPIYTETLANALKVLILQKAKGLYHLGAIDFTTNLRFARKVATNFGYDPKLIHPITLNTFLKNKKAKRAKYCWLDCTKFKEDFGNKILKSIDDDLASFRQKFGSPV